MKKRIRFISHKGKKILLVDCYQLFRRSSWWNWPHWCRRRLPPQPRLIGTAAGGFYRRDV